MKDIENSKKEAPMLGLTGMGGGVASLMWAGAGETLYNLFTWGKGNKGQLGQNSNTYRSSPTQIPSGTADGWTYVWTGSSYQKNSFGASREAGTLWTWGSNGEGNLGHNNQTEYSSPKQVGTDTNWAFVGVGKETCIATKTDGTLWNWGHYQYIAKVPGVPAPQQRDKSSPMQVGTDTDWRYESTNGGSPLANASNFNLAIKQNGSLWVWGVASPGAGVFGALGLNDTSSEPNQRASRSSPHQIGTETTWAYLGKCGRVTSTGMKTDGSCWVWGRNNNGALGLNDEVSRSSPTQLSGTGWKKLTVDTDGSLGTKTDGTLWGWGSNDTGVLGHNNNNNYSSPKQVGTDTNWHDVETGGYGEWVKATKTDGTLWGWGNNTQGQLGLNNNTKYSSPVQIPGFVDGRKDVVFGNLASAAYASAVLSEQ
jgi:alpha-tubulin suppressor-like RCC1 family protein